MDTISLLNAVNHRYGEFFDRRSFLNIARRNREDRCESIQFNADHALVLAGFLPFFILRRHQTCASDFLGLALGPQNSPALAGTFAFS